VDTEGKARLDAEAQQVQYLQSEVELKSAHIRMTVNRRNPRVRRYSIMVPLALLLITGGMLAVCAAGTPGAPGVSF